VYRGEIRQRDLRLSRLVHRDAVSKTHLSVRGWSRQSGNFIDDTEIEVQRRRTAGWELGAQHQRTVGATALSLGIAYRRGTGAAGALAAPEDAFGEGASRPRILSADLSVSLPLRASAPGVRYGAVASAQWSQQPLVPQDRFAIGGRHSVRGFDGERSLSAARGWWLRQELQWAVAASGQSLYLGLDHGEVGGAASESLAGTRLTGAVIGLRGTWRRASWDLFAARPVKKPEMFRTADRTAGFSLQVSF
jgi:hemolysin activation/secretion protein